MTRRSRVIGLFLAWGLALGLGCPRSGPLGPPDAGIVDAGPPDAGADGGLDAGSTGVDGGHDAGLDGGHDGGGLDAGPDAGNDAGVHAGTDAGTDAGLLDAGTDAGPCLEGSDCSDPSRPWCIKTTGACVQCLVESDCSDAGATPHCLIETGGRAGPDDHTCVQCRDAYDCPSSVFGLAGCQPAGNPGYAGHYCGRCNSGGDCRAAPGADAGICLTSFPYDGVIPESCGCDLDAGNTGCGSDAPECMNAGLGIAVGVCGCTDGKTVDYCDATAGEACDTQNFVVGACVQRCDLDGGCGAFPNSPVCAPDGGICVGCMSDADCGGGQTCDQPTHICRSSCSNGKNCPASQPYCDPSGLTTGLCYECQLVYPTTVHPTGCPNDTHGDPTFCTAFFTNPNLYVCY